MLGSTLREMEKRHGDWSRVLRVARAAEEMLPVLRDMVSTSMSGPNREMALHQIDRIMEAGRE